MRIPGVRLVRWLISGSWWVRAPKAIVLAVVLYNVVTFVLMWCPPVKGVVLDIETGEPIAGAIVQKSGLGPFIFYTESPGGSRIGGAEAETITDSKGCFSFPGAFAHPTTRDYARWMVYWPFQWLNTISVVAWHPGYIGASSSSEGLWWRERSPDRSGGYCKIKRYRIPILGFHYKILLKKPVTEAEWQVKIASVNLAGIEGGQEIEEERLFNDLTGYLERWPRGDKARAYVVNLYDLAIATAGPFCAGDSQTVSRISSVELKSMLGRMEKILSLVDTLPGPDETKDPVRARNWPGEREDLKSCVETIRHALAKREGRSNGW